MHLENALTQALNRTREIREALDRDDLAGALELIPVRGAAMETLQAAHLGATHTELAACRELFQELHRLDAALQEDAGSRLEEAAGQLHAVTAGQNSRPEKQPCLTSCVDRLV
ncbi:hypothetical protein COW53_03560 [bacterium CG17_big_fil_post_rev_8_21_14_2_50_64_8]|nr:MAG: hypothetical protein COW53_03560 [bacterium CG17_big_fil_post_rev_8_21_14_2_50_64_8]PJA77232.1 MAG: hypothetical protein CO151_00030 [bacterium CG_4_9_14_3_um_filter_65_15]